MNETAKTASDDGGPLTVRDLICALLEHPLDSVAYVGKGIGPVLSVESASGIGGGYVILSPVKER
jgi:hypothetical protein